MVTHIKIHGQSYINAFETPPKLSVVEQEYFYLPTWADKKVKSFHNPTNKVGFFLQLGYFKLTNKFFIAKKYHKVDLIFACRELSVSIAKVDLRKYFGTTYERHQNDILENTGFQKFDSISKSILIEEAYAISSKQVKPKLVFMSLIDFLGKKKIEIPSYYAISEIITAAIKSYEKKLLEDIDKHMTREQKFLLEELLEKNSQINRYKITFLKKSKQSTKPKRIKENIEDFAYLRNVFFKLELLIKYLDIAPELLDYYANSVIKSQISQIPKSGEKKYLLFICFVVHQYYSLSDLLIETLLQSVQSIINTSLRENKENFYQERQQRHKNVYNFAKVVDHKISLLESIRGLVHTEDLPAESIIRMVKYLFAKDKEIKNFEFRENISLLEKYSNKVIKDDDYYDVLEKKSIKLQNRVSDIVKQLHFDKDSSEKNILSAIEYYKSKNGVLNIDAPLLFLSEEEQNIVFFDEGKLRVSLYKVLLFEKITEAIKSGALNLVHCYKYKAFEHYLIDKNLWERTKQELLEKANLSEFINFENIEQILRETMSCQYHTTNQNINEEKNKHVKFVKGNLVVKTPKHSFIEKNERVSILFPKNQYIPLFEILSTINKTSNFINCFQHWKAKNNQTKPKEKVFFAGIIGYGCNLGIRKIAKISRSINTNELENTINWYFNSETLNLANDKVLELMDSLDLPKVFKRQRSKTHTSSDGQKFSICVESLNSNYSFKYFGKGKGVTVYGFIDESHKLFHSLVISPSEREAAYVIDGLMHNDVVQSDIHSTDTHGFSEAIFGITHLLGISFAPRIKNFQHQKLYSFEDKSVLKSLDYAILPDQKINIDLAKDQWDDILRFVTTIKVKETSASQLFRRLNSYSRQHPLYLALREFGRIIKTIFLLKYIDDVSLRQAIEKQLNKIESSNKFGKAVFYGNNQEFQHSTAEEQLTVEGCKRLIENSIICWNYLYLSQLIHQTKNQKEKEELVNIIKNGSVVTWQHINLHGEYDFSEEKLKNSIVFDLAKILRLRLD